MQFFCFMNPLFSLNFFFSLFSLIVHFFTMLLFKQMFINHYLMLNYLLKCLNVILNTKQNFKIKL